MSVKLKALMRSAGLATVLCCLGLVSAKATDVTIGYSVPSMGSAFWTSATYGVEKEAEASGTKLIKVDAGSDNNVAQQIGQIQDLIQRHVNAIIIGAANDDALKPIAERAIAAGYSGYRVLNTAKHRQNGVVYWRRSLTTWDGCKRSAWERPSAARARSR